jgi:CelD/BcsL family acetyltransferase involved in cellulose biosynthesis
MKRSGQFSTRVVAADRVESGDVAAWAALESRAIEPNAFLSPYFVIPAARYLTPDQVPLAFFVERKGAVGRELVGVGVFTEAAATKRTPVRRLVGYRSRHSFLSGLLLDREYAAPALEALLEFIRKSLPHCKAIEIPLVMRDGALTGSGGIAAQVCSHAPKIAEVKPRAILVVADCNRLLRDKTLVSRIRNIDRNLRRLRERGAVAWRWYREAGTPAEAVEAFLSLEHMGWKGDEGSSLRSRPEDEAFFREAVSGFASERRTLFLELTLDGVPIASICNFIAGNVGFGFKTAFDPAFRSASPGLINELELMRHAPTNFGDIEYFDSGAGPASFINELWLSRCRTATIRIPTGWVGASSIAIADWAVKLKVYARNSSRLIADHSRARQNAGQNASASESI